jgi:hypothetical protein
METKVENYYREQGWQLLNIAKTGGLGGRMPIYSDDFVRDIAKKYTVLKDFWKDHKKMVNTIIKHNKPLYDEVTSHMQRNVGSGVVKYTLEDIMNIASNYDNVSDFRKDYPKIYSVMASRGIVQQVTNHMSRKVVRNYTDNQLKAIASKYKTVKDFRSNNSGAYGAAYRRGIIGDITQHMVKAPNIPKGKDYWINKALSYGTLKGLSTKDPNLYMALVRNKLMDKVKKLFSERNS